MSSPGSQPKPKQVAPPPLMGIAQIAAWLGVGERHVRRLISERRIPYVKWGHYIRFDPVEVDEWLRSNRIIPMRALGKGHITATAPRRRSERTPRLGPAMGDEDQDDQFRHSGEYLQSLRGRAGMTLEEVAARAGVDPAWLDNVERNGTHDLLCSQICDLVRATQPPRPEWWDEGYEHDFNLGPNAVVGPLSPSQLEY